MRSAMGRRAPGERLWSKARNVVTAVRAFKRPSSDVDLDKEALTKSISNPVRAMTEMPSPRKTSKKGCIALIACVVFVVALVIISTVVGVLTTSNTHDGNGDEDMNANSVAGICSKTL